MICFWQLGRLKVKNIATYIHAYMHTCMHTYTHTYSEHELVSGYRLAGRPKSFEFVVLWLKHWTPLASPPLAGKPEIHPQGNSSSEFVPENSPPEETSLDIIPGNSSPDIYPWKLIPGTSSRPWLALCPPLSGFMVRV